MSDLDALDARRHHHDLDAFAGAPPTATRPSSAPPTAPRRVTDTDDAFAHLDAQFAATTRAVSGLGAFVANASRASATSATAHSTRNEKIRAGMNAFRDIASGPYTAEGKTVSAPPHFVMVGGMGIHPRANQLQAFAAANHVHANVGLVLSGRGSATDVRTLTQALIDHGKLPAGDAPLADRIRQMQWNYGIGFDCVGYAQQSIAFALGRTPESVFHDGQKPPAGGSVMTNQVNEKALKKTTIVDAQPGDLLILGKPANDDAGHKVAIFANEVVGGDRARTEILGKLAAGTSAVDAAAAFQGGPIHRYEVDSSWGGGTDGQVGGFRRATAFFNESTGVWASEDHQGHFVVSRQPFDHPIDGVYRPHGGR